MRCFYLTPLGLHDTGYDQPEVVLAQRAWGYVLEDETLCNASAIYVPIPAGGGNLYSTCEDLARWDRALCENQLRSAAGYETFYRPALENYDCGWRVREK